MLGKLAFQRNSCLRSAAVTEMTGTRDRDCKLLSHKMLEDSGHCEAGANTRLRRLLHVETEEPISFYFGFASCNALRVLRRPWGFDLGRSGHLDTFAAAAIIGS